MKITEDFFNELLSIHEVLRPSHLIMQAADALTLPKEGRVLPTEDVCLRLELAQRYINLLFSLATKTPAKP